MARCSYERVLFLFFLPWLHVAPEKINSRANLTQPPPSIVQRSFSFNMNRDIDPDGKIGLADNDSGGTGPVCYSWSRQIYLGCAQAEKNDLCDTDIHAPDIGYLADSVFDGSDCVPFQEETWLSRCGDGLDNDGNGLVDNADNGCFISGWASLNQWRSAQGGYDSYVNFGAYETDCEDKKDNDGDGWFDCWDEDCFYGEACPEVSYGNCEDLNGNGRMEWDWGDVEIRQNRKTVVCAQLYDVGNADSPDEAGRSFLTWMRDHHYTGRVIALMARAMRDPVKRYIASEEGVSFQEYFDKRASRSLPYVIFFKGDGPFRVVFHEVRATDSWIGNTGATEEDADTLKEILEKTYFRTMEVSYQYHEVNYEATFGLISCALGTCRDKEKVDSWAESVSDPEAFNFFHVAGESDDPDRDFFNPLFQTKYGFGMQPHMIPGGGGCNVYSHEMGHRLGLPHPLVETSLDLKQELDELLGVTSVMSDCGYVYTSISLLGPLEVYALEPDAGFDDSDFGVKYSAQFLSSRKTIRFQIKQ